MEELSIFDLMLPAFAECLVLVGIHSYLGLHVIRRKVIFVDLALAQVAALGTTIGFLFGMAPDSTAALIFSMLFTFVGAAVFSLSRIRGDKIPQEAVIGLVYALAAAVVILVVDRAPHGAEHIKEVMTGAILWVRFEDIAFAAIVYSCIGLVHYLFRKQFILISDNPEEAYQRGMRVRLWDFLFYVTFGVVISISVQTAGVLLVFVFLVVPAIVATLITDRLLYQLIIGWVIGTIVSMLGLALSYWGDMPSGPAVVSIYGAMLVVMALVLFVLRAPRKRGALYKLGIGIVGTVGVSIFLYVVGYSLGQSSLAHGRVHRNLSNHDDQYTHDGEKILEKEKPSLFDDARGLLSVLDGKNDAEQREILASLDETHISVLFDAFHAAGDPLIKLAIAAHVSVHNQTRGFCLFYEILKNDESPFTRSEALSSIEKIAGQKFGFDVEREFRENGEGRMELENWMRNKAISCP